jgi:hypothetical protein
VHVDLPGETQPDGSIVAQSMELRDPTKVSNKLRRRVAQAIAAVSADTYVKLATLTPDEAARAVQPDADQDDALRALLKRRLGPDAIAETWHLDDELAVALIESWTFPFPVSLEGLEELGHETYDKIIQATAPLLGKLMPQFEVNPEPDSPTEPSGE